MDYAEIVDADVRELRATCDLADRPDAGRGGLQPLVDLDVSPVGELNAGQFQAESFGVRIAACVPVLTLTFAPRGLRVVPSARVTSTVLGARNRPVPNLNSAPVFL